MQITEKVDVYALGTVLFRCLAGRTPFITEGRGDVGLMHLCAQQIAEPVPPLREFAPTVPASLSALVERTLAKEPAERPTMKELAAELSRLLLMGISDEGPTRMLPPSPVQVTARQPELKTISRHTKDRRPPAWLPRWQYLVAGGVALVWLVLLALWAFRN
jgi:serine/threonine protein kinase